MLHSFKTFFLLHEEVDDFTKRFFASFNYPRKPEVAVFDQIGQLTDAELDNLYQSSFFLNLPKERQEYVQKQIHDQKNMTFGQLIKGLEPMVKSA